MPPARWTGAALALLGLAVSFNFILALVNAQVAGLNPAIVTLTQGGIIAASAALGLAALQPGWLRWAMVGWIALVLWLVLSVLRGAADLRGLGDIAMLPVFALLGSVLTPRAFLRGFLWLTAVVAILALIELLFPKLFAAVLNVQSYYVNTRGYAADTFYSPENEGLFLNVARGTGRGMFPQTGWNRATSLFLEPISLGNWAVLSVIVVLAFWKKLEWPTRILLAAFGTFLIVACDGRFALTAALIIVALAPIALVAPRWWPVVYVPLLMLNLILARSLGVLRSGGDDLVSRLRKGIDYVLDLGLPDVLGTRSLTRIENADSGWAYLIQSQSLIGFVLYWCFVVFAASRNRTREGRLFVHSVALYFALCMPISYSLVSIKTLAPICAMLGLLATLAEREGRGPPALLRRSGRGETSRSARPTGAPRREGDVCTSTTP